MESTIQNLSQYPKVPVYIDESILIQNDIFEEFKSGWYCLPVIGGLSRICPMIMKIASKQKDLSVAIKACTVHNTFDGKLSEEENIALLGKEAGINI